MLLLLYGQYCTFEGSFIVTGVLWQLQVCNVCLSSTEAADSETCAGEPSCLGHRFVFNDFSCNDSDFSFIMLSLPSVYEAI